MERDVCNIYNVIMGQMPAIIWNVIKEKCQQHVKNATMEQNASNT